MKPYLSLEKLLSFIDEPNGAGCLRLYKDNEELFKTTYGSVHNHQTWLGGYWDHIHDGLNIAVRQYIMLDGIGRPLPFSLSDLLLVYSVHDIEKPWKYQYDNDGNREIIPELVDKQAQHVFRAKKLEEYKITLNEMQQNGMLYAEGENAAYSPNHRVMNELAAVVHTVDLLSARVYYAHPLATDDPWVGAKRCNANA